MNLNNRLEIHRNITEDKLVNKEAKHQGFAFAFNVHNLGHVEFLDRIFVKELLPGNGQCGGYSNASAGWCK